MVGPAVADEAAEVVTPLLAPLAIVWFSRLPPMVQADHHISMISHKMARLRNNLSFVDEYKTDELLLINVVDCLKRALRQSVPIIVLSPDANSYI